MRPQRRNFLADLLSAVVTFVKSMPVVKPDPPAPVVPTLAAAQGAQQGAPGVQLVQLPAPGQAGSGITLETNTPGARHWGRGAAAHTSDAAAPSRPDPPSPTLISARHLPLPPSQSRSARQSMWKPPYGRCGRGLATHAGHLAAPCAWLQACHVGRAMVQASCQCTVLVSHASCALHAHVCMNAMRPTPCAPCLSPTDQLAAGPMRQRRRRHAGDASSCMPGDLPEPAAAWNRAWNGSIPLAGLQ